MSAPISEKVKTVFSIHIYHSHSRAVLAATGTVVYPARQELQHALHTMQMGAVHWNNGPSRDEEADAAAQVSQGLDVVCK